MFTCDIITEECSDNDPYEFSALNRGKMTERTDLNISFEQQQFKTNQSVLQPSTQEIQPKDLTPVHQRKNSAFNRKGSKEQIYRAVDAKHEIINSKTPKVGIESPLKVKCTNFKELGAKANPTQSRSNNVSPSRNKSPVKSVSTPAVPGSNKTHLDANKLDLADQQLIENVMKNLTQEQEPREIKEPTKLEVPRTNASRGSPIRPAGTGKYANKYMTILNQ